MSSHQVMNSVVRVASVLCFLILTTAGPARAATRTVCFDLELRDDQRTNCPTTTTGVKRPCQADNFGTNYDYMIGFEIDVYDKDNASQGADEFIGTWHIAGSGTQCVTFEWEGAPYYGGEAHPDVYIQLTNAATASWGDHSTLIDIVDDNNDEYPDISWRGGEGDNTFVASNCTASSTCYIPNDMAPFTAGNDDLPQSEALLAVDSAQRALEMYHDLFNNGTIYMEVPSSECANSCAVSRGLLRIAASDDTDGIVPPHELGHVLQMHLFEQDTLVDDCSLNGGGWSATSVEYQSCATTEGWAEYVAIGSWYNAASTSANPVASGTNMETASLINSDPPTNAWVPGQVTKAFWDLDDANNEAGVADCDGVGGIDDDGNNWGTSLIAGGWDSFPDGTANRQDREASVHGVNARDYDFNYDVPDETFLHHNCLGTQAN